MQVLVLLSLGSELKIGQVASEVCADTMIPVLAHARDISSIAIT